MNPKQVVLVVCGYKNVGKTRLMNLLITTFSNKGYRIASIKHDGHDFDSDVRGTDSDQHHRAGAYASAIFSSSKWAMVQEECVSLQEMISKFSEADLIFIEGCKSCRYPKIEVLRKGVSETLKEDPYRLAIVADFMIPEETVYAYEQPQELLDLIQDYIEEVRHA